ncbi:ankyrin repeat domain-containing protein 26-like [Lynx rufus]|uniref:ankyrin repeat domain-containing protein 26-like n=1 Tax=Lynx rufus TaxID=61384 RepID=UPI001F127641|nr:ankyrin repeat domain-containing protein 26-like [Lynx rufus]
MEVSENIHDAAAAGLIPQRQNGKTDNHQLPFGEKKDSDRRKELKWIGWSEPGLHMKKLKEGENEKGTSKGSVITPVLKKADSLTGGPLQKNDGSHFSEKDQHESRPAKKISKKKNKVKKEITSMDDLVDFIQSSESETASEDCELPYSKNFMLLIEQLGMDCKDSAGFLKIQNILVSYERLRKLNKNHCKRLTGKIKKMEKTVSALQNELQEAKDVTSWLEHQKVEWEREVCSLRFTLKQEEEKRRNAEMLYEKIREKLRRIEDQYQKEVETKQEFELALRTRNMELKAAKDHLNQLSDSREKMQDLLHKNHMLQDEIAMLRLERDTIKNQNQRKETKYCEDIESVKEKNDNLQKTIKQNEETLSKTIFRYSGQLNALTAEITMLKSKLENEKQKKESLEAEVESYRARLATAVHDHDQSQTSRRDLELAFQRPRDEDGHLQDQMTFDVSKLQDNNELLSRQLSQDESKFNALEIELHHTKDALREKTVVLECEQRDLSQTQCQKMEIEHMYQKEQSKVNKYIAKQESFEERLSQLQSENMLLRQQLDAAHNHADSEEKLVINMQDQFQNVQKYLKAKREEQGLMLGERNNELINECKHLKERMYKYKNEKGKLEVVVRELQQKLADTLKKQSMSHASPEVISHLRLEDERRDLKKKLGRIRSQYQVPLKVEEKKKHRGSDMEVSENIHDAAAAGLIPQRQNGKTDNHQLPFGEKKDSDRRKELKWIGWSEPGLHMKKLKEGENEKGTSKGSVITPVLKKADSLTGGPLQKNDGSHFSEKDQHESRPAKKISKKKNKVKKEITSMDDLVDFIQSSESETASEDCELPYSKNFMLLIEQLGMDCKGRKPFYTFLPVKELVVSNSFG